MKQRITVQSPTRVADAFGGHTTAWADAYVLWASVKAVRGRELEIQGRQASVETYLITTRFGPSVGTTDRILWNGKTMNIRSAQDRDSERRYLTIEAEVGVGP